MKSDLAKEIAARGLSEERSKVVMAKVKCVGCGAGLEPGQKFCPHCGTAVPDDTFRAEIRIDDTADIQRVSYEAQESKLRQKAMAAELRKKKIVWIVAALFALVSAIFVTLALTVHNRTDGGLSDIFWFFLFGGVAVVLAWKNLSHK